MRILLLSLLLSGAAQAQPCSPIAESLQKAKSYHESHPETTLTEYFGKDVETILTIINAIPPKTTLSANSILVLNSIDGFARLGMINKDCMLGPLSISSVIWELIHEKLTTPDNAIGEPL